MNRILRRCALLTAGVGILVMLAAFAVLQWRDLTEAAVTSARQQADLVAAVAASTTDPDRLLAAVEETSAGAHGDLAVHLSDGRTIGASHAWATDVQTRIPRSVEVAGGSILLRPVPVPDGVAVIETHLSTSDIIGPLLRRLSVMVACGAVAITVAVFVGRATYRPLIRSMRAVTSAASATGQGQRGVEIPPTAATEVAELVSTLNQLSRRVERLIASERELVADLSHRLRTPLTAARLDAEKLGDDVVSDRMRHAVQALADDLDDLIRSAESNTEPAVERCDVAAVVGNRMAFWSTLAEHEGRGCQFVRDTDEAPVDLSEKDIGAVVDALVGNVFQHTPRETPFAATVVRYANWVTLVIEDGGPGIPDVNAALRRGASSQGSTGLGLDIARHAVETTGGTVHIDHGRLGGARIRLRFAESGTDHTAAQPRAWRLWSREPDLPA
jgi:signal transduction histidine kinase